MLCLPAGTLSAGLRGPCPAASAAAHLAGILLGTVVGGHVTAVVGVSAVAVQGGVSAAIAGEIQGAAVDGQGSVGVYAVSCGHNGEEPSVDENEAVGVGGKGVLLLSGKACEAGTVCSAGGIEAIITGDNVKGTVLDGNGQAFDAFIAVGDGKTSASDGKGGIAVDRIIPAAESECPGGNGRA